MNRRSTDRRNNYPQWLVATLFVMYVSGLLFAGYSLMKWVAGGGS